MPLYLNILGGIGLHVHNIRANHSFINGTNGYSNGIVPMLIFLMIQPDILIRVEKKKWIFCYLFGTMASDIFDFLELKKNHGNELERARDLFYGLWIPDLFMKLLKMEKNGL